MFRAAPVAAFLGSVLLASAGVAAGERGVSNPPDTVTVHAGQGADVTIPTNLKPVRPIDRIDARVGHDAQNRPQEIFIRAGRGDFIWIPVGSR
jgi:hypothetical protein